ncbi:uncharacterized protein LOC124499128 [Dermatophagoides farinae]|uniref:uncharacterized protein LOC124499128 n=1 Tax=Dermatophagoides farinae TaxID=6954 RepID=UPI003F60FF79
MTKQSKSKKKIDYKMALFDNQSIDNDDGHEQQQQQQQQEQESPKMVKLSLMAYFDDMCRYQNYLSSYVKSLHNDFAKVLKICDQFKTKYSLRSKELEKAHQHIDELTMENCRLDKDLRYFKEKFLEKSNDCEKINKELIDLRSKVEKFAKVVNFTDFDKKSVKQSKTTDEEENEKLLSRLHRLRCVDDDNQINIENDEKLKNHRIHLDAIIEEEEEKEKEKQCNVRIDPREMVEKSLAMSSSPNSSDLTIDISEVDEPSIVSLKPSDKTTIASKKVRTNGHIKFMKIDDETIYKKHSNVNDGYHSLCRFAHLLHPPYLEQPEQQQHLTKIHDTPPPSPSHEHRWESTRSTSHRMITCAICHDRIGFYSTYVSCDDCGARAHDNCINNNPSKRYSRSIMDFVQTQLSESPSSTTCGEPLVPTLLLKCCSEIEKRGLRLVNIYDQNQMNVSIIQNLMLDLLDPKKQQKFSQIDIDSLCNIVIYFLGYLIDLGDPLIPGFLYDDVLNLLKNQSDGIDSIICQLPSCNRDTLAFLMIHLRKVAKNQNYNNMSLKKLARIFAPKIFHPSFTTSVQEKVLMALLSVSSDYWINIISQDTPSSSPTLVLLNNSLEDDNHQHYQPNIFQSPCSYKSAVTSESVYNTPIGGGGGGISIVTPSPTSGGRKIRTFKRFDFSRFLVENLKF